MIRYYTAAEIRDIWRRPVASLPRAPQRVGCEHPVTLNLTVLSDPSERSRCCNCGADWMTWPRNRP